MSSKSRSRLNLSGSHAKLALILAKKDNYPIARMGRQLSIIRSSFYAWRARADTVTATQALRDVLKPEFQHGYSLSLNSPTDQHSMIAHSQQKKASASHKNGRTLTTHTRSIQTGLSTGMCVCQVTRQLE